MACQTQAAGPPGRPLNGLRSGLEGAPRRDGGWRSYGVCSGRAARVSSACRAPILVGVFPNHGCAVKVHRRGGVAGRGARPGGPGGDGHRGERCRGLRAGCAAGPFTLGSRSFSIVQPFKSPFNPVLQSPKRKPRYSVVSSTPPSASGTGALHFASALLPRRQVTAPPHSTPQCPGSPPPAPRGSARSGSFRCW